MKLVTVEDVRYTQQQKAIDEIANRLGIVAFRPKYHGKEGDKNTVLFYTKADNAKCRELDGAGVPCDAPGYPRQFWSFENSDQNGRFDYGAANNGKLDLRTLKWKERLEGHIRFALARKRQIEYIRAIGGVLELGEADDVQNDMNREMLAAMKMMYGRLYLGSVNCHDDKKRRKIANGSEPVYEELHDQQIYNFYCDFAVPTKDEELESLLRAWSGMSSIPKMADADAITSRVREIGGINLIWT